MRDCNAVVFGLLGRVLVGCGKPAQSGVTCFIAPVGRRDSMIIRPHSTRERQNRCDVKTSDENILQT